MVNSTLLLKPGTLWPKVLERTEHALRCMALQPISTGYEFIEQDGVRFLVRVLSNLARKDEAGEARVRKTTRFEKPFNPFLPYEHKLFVADISDTHLCLLNKFNVIDHHLLLVTRSFEQQESLLTLQDFAALWACMSEFESLAFYNAGRIAGASQQHKHLQLVPLPLAPEGPRIPIETLLASSTPHEHIGTVSGLPFAHAVTRLAPNWLQSGFAKAVATLECHYHALLRAVGLHSNRSGNSHVGAYNLLATQQWMMVIPRSQECFESISVNALGFAGALLVRNEQQLKSVQAHGPMIILRQLAMSRNEP